MKQKWLERRFVVLDDETEVKIYFYPKAFSVSEHEVEMTIYTMLYDGYCTGAELSRLMNGEVRLYFNPIHHGKKIRKKATRQIINVIDAAYNDICEEDS